MQCLRQLPRQAPRVHAPAFPPHASRLTNVCSPRRLGTAAPQSKPSITTPSSSTPEPSARRQRLRDDAKPFSDFLTDTFQRQHDYLRISITERCNLRCVYCMPEEGVPLSPNRDLLTTPEILLLSSVFVAQGVTKIRLTGGEPTVRRDILPLMRDLGALRARGLRELCLTTNGISLHRKLDAMVDAGLTGVNLSLDTLDPWQFQIMTRRKGFDAVLRSMDRVLDMNRAGAGVKLKVNCVVMRGVNDAEVLPFVELTRHKDMEVRFIEYMPFDGNKWNKRKMLGYQEMLDTIRAAHPSLQQLPGHRNDTSKTWHVPGFAGRIGFITSMTHNFCGTCNRLRITGDGNLKVCLFGNAEVSLRDILRRANGGEPIDDEAYEAMKRIEMDRRQGLVSADTPLGMAPNEAELLDVIRVAVKGKKAKHAGIGELEHMKNRPMILIDPVAPTLHGTIPRRVQHLISTPQSHPSISHQRRLFSSTPRQHSKDDSATKPPTLTHVSETGAAHMVSIAHKTVTARVATAACTVRFSSAVAPALIRANQLKKGDVLGVARVAGIMAAKRTPDLIPLCHPVAVSHVGVDLVLSDTSVEVRATVECDGKTGVEMEALTAASTAALTVYDMCKAVDKRMVVDGLRVVLKDGGKSGRWEMD
ncbi:molybdenum cofactor biosynthesis 1 B [Cordyceps militaris]|uniref:Molybdenum cofactor biosynthesis 1 B n=1 Tax=Cordyceps militaris TaxID=73501 RepID=A0A2H4S972_CORMI|nr:molybdenum cofactor biosynthesis 1 B [Cordyceps militaris]